MAKVRLQWLDFNYGEEEQRIYRSTSTIDPENPPSPLATVAAGETSFVDDTAAADTNYYYRVSSVFGGDEYFSDEIEADTSVTADVLDSVDMTDTLANIISAVESNSGLEVVASIQYENIAESTSLVNIIDAYGQHKWPHTNKKVRRMWILLKNNANDEVLRVYAERQTDAVDPDTLIYEPATWKFQALWDGDTHVGEGTWELSSNAGDVSFSGPTLSEDDGTWAFGDGINTQGDQSRPSGVDIWGAGNWNSTDGSSGTSMNVGPDSDDITSNFQGIIVFAP